MGITSGLAAVAFDLDLDILHEIEAVFINNFSFYAIHSFELEKQDFHSLFIKSAMLRVWMHSLLDLIIICLSVPLWPVHVYLIPHQRNISKEDRREQSLSIFFCGSGEDRLGLEKRPIR